MVLRTVVSALLLTLLVGCSTAGASRQAPPPPESSEMEDLAESLERLRDAVDDALGRLSRAQQASVPLSVDRQALEEVERILAQTLAEFRGEISTAGLRPLTPRQRLERLHVAVDAFVETLLLDIRSAGAADVVAADSAEIDEEEPTPETAARVPVPDHLVPIMADGERVFSRTCAVCHGGQGEGRTAPGLDGARRLSESSFAASMILWGVPGHGMPGFHDQLSDEEVAAVATYIRNAWSNDFGPMSQEAVREAREVR